MLVFPTQEADMQVVPSDVDVWRVAVVSRVAGQAKR